MFDLCEKRLYNKRINEQYGTFRQPKPKNYEDPNLRNYYLKKHKNDVFSARSNATVTHKWVRKI